MYKNFVILLLSLLSISCLSNKHIIEAKITTKFIEEERYLSPNTQYIAIIGREKEHYISIPKLRIIKDNQIIFETKELFTPRWMEGEIQIIGWSKDNKYFIIYYDGEHNSQYFNIYYVAKNYLIRNFIINFDLINSLINELENKNDI